MPGTPPTIPPRAQPPTHGIAALRRMEARLVAGRPPGPGELETPWEAYLAAVRRAGIHRRTDLAADVVDELRADHDALVRSLRAGVLAAAPTDEPQLICRCQIDEIDGRACDGVA